MLYNVNTAELEGVWAASSRTRPAAAGQPDKIVWKPIARWPALQRAEYQPALSSLLPFQPGVPVRVVDSARAGLEKALLKSSGSAILPPPPPPAAPAAAAARPASTSAVAPAAAASATARNPTMPAAATAAVHHGAPVASKAQENPERNGVAAAAAAPVKMVCPICNAQAPGWLSQGCGHLGPCLQCLPVGVPSSAVYSECWQCRLPVAQLHRVRF